MRAAWIATVDNIDWPAKGVTDPAQQKEQFISLLDQLENAGMNAVIMQIKPTADAFYPSEYGPWSEWLTGEQGKNPGYDPLAFLLEEVHKRNMEFHAWFNPYRISLQGDVNQLVEDHPPDSTRNGLRNMAASCISIQGCRRHSSSSLMESWKSFGITISMPCILTIISTRIP